jgi:TolB-like protein
MSLNADMLGGSVDIATSFTLMRGNEQVWRKNFNKKTKINVYTDLGKVLAKVLAGVLEDGLERAGQQYATAVAAAPAAAAPPPKAAPSQPQLAVLDFHGPLAPATLRLLADEARGGVLEAGGGRYLIMTREAVNARLKDKGKCTSDEDACDLESGKGSGADLIVTGTVARLGKRLRASLKVMDMKSGALVASKSFSAENEEGLADLVKANASAALRDAQPH